MKTKIAIVFMALLAGYSCKKETEIVDPIYEFVSFVPDSPVNVNEADNTSVGVPLVIQLWAFKAYSEDIDVTLGVDGHNAAENVDFTVTPDNTVKIRAGKLTSDTIWVKTIDNAVGNNLERTFDVKIKSISKSDVKVGLGIADPKKSSVTVKITDDECSGSPLCVFNTTLNNKIGGSTVNTAAVVLDKNNSKITVSGDLIDYSTFANATLTMTFVPASPGSATGTVTFDTQPTGTDGDGYEYEFTQVNAGTYDADQGIISVEYDIYYMDGGSWVYWYTVTNEFSVP